MKKFNHEERDKEQRRKRPFSDVRTAPGHARWFDVAAQSGGLNRTFHCRRRLDELDFRDVKS